MSIYALGHHPIHIIADVSIWEKVFRMYWENNIFNTLDPQTYLFRPTFKVWEFDVNKQNSEVKDIQKNKGGLHPCQELCCLSDGPEKRKVENVVVTGYVRKLVTNKV